MKRRNFIKGIGVGLVSLAGVGALAKSMPAPEPEMFLGYPMIEGRIENMGGGYLITPECAEDIARQVHKLSPFRSRK